MIDNFLAEVPTQSEIDAVFDVLATLPWLFGFLGLSTSAALSHIIEASEPVLPGVTVDLVGVGVSEVA